MITFVDPSVERYVQTSDVNSHISKCARICYASEGKTSDADLVQHLLNGKHFSMFRHASAYYRIPFNKFPKNSIQGFLNKYTPYISYIVSDKEGDKACYVSANLNVLYEHPEFAIKLGEFRLVGEGSIPTDIACHLVRYTLVCVTQISTSRELNRTSPNNIAEQSTRYVNFNKKGAITICKPYWYDKASKFLKFLIKSYLTLGSWLYNYIIKYGFKAQDAREVLTLMTATKVAYTYTVDEWRHILDLRLYGNTGAPHPNAKLIANYIRQELLCAGESV